MEDAEEQEEGAVVCEVCVADATCDGGDNIPRCHSGFWQDFSTEKRDDMANCFRCPGNTCKEMEMDVTTDSNNQAADQQQQGSSAVMGDPTKRTLALLPLDTNTDQKRQQSQRQQRRGRKLVGTPQECITYDEVSATEEVKEMCMDPTLTCSEGSYGPMCGSCEKGYFISKQSRTCEKCDLGELSEGRMNGFFGFIKFHSLSFS